jgi:hypothetical protein
MFNDLSISTRQAMLDAWLQEYLPILLSDPDKLDGSEDKEEAKVN